MRERVGLSKLERARTQSVGLDRFERECAPGSCDLPTRERVTRVAMARVYTLERTLWPSE